MGLRGPRVHEDKKACWMLGPDEGPLLSAALDSSSACSQCAFFPCAFLFRGLFLPRNSQFHDGRGLFHLAPRYLTLKHTHTPNG